jgi:hypothetical protein
MHIRNKTFSRPALREITREEFKRHHDTLLPTYPDQGDRNQIIANSLVKHYLSREWLDTYIRSTSPDADYLRVDINAPLPERAKAMIRYWEFAETLLNLQDVEGFEIVLDELMHGKIESACAEIDIARMIIFHDLRFRFIKPNRGTKLNYDFEIYYKDGLMVCAEAAAKLESTTPNARSILKSIRESRAQLPDDEPSIVLIKVPEKWLRDVPLANKISNVANGYLHQSTHIMSIKFYAPVTVYLPTATGRWHAYLEVSNPKFRDRNWDMFRDETVPEHGMPDWWMRFYPQLRIPTDAEWKRRPIQPRRNSKAAR